METRGALRRALNPFGDTYPDDDTAKEIVLQAEGLAISDLDDRHVDLRWVNGIDDETSTRYTQIIHLAGGPGNYQFHPVQVKAQFQASLARHKSYILGSYTRPQRDRILELAKAIKFNPKSRVNNCQTWMCDLLQAMVDHDLLSSPLGPISREL